MRPEDVRNLLKKQPFQPFRIHLSNGSSYEVRHPELAVVGTSTMFIGHPKPDGKPDIYDDFDLVSILHINNVEPVSAGSPPTTNGPA